MILIVVYHLLRLSLPGGFLAVEVFFTLSGFLIASKLFAAYKKGEKMSFWRFVWSRVKKFYPAMIMCVILTLTFGYFAAPDMMTRARENTLAALTFSTNIVDIVNGTSYEAQIIPNVFQHFWFLALILQIYIIIYGIMWLTMGIKQKYRDGVKLTMWVAGGLAVASYTLMAIYGGRYGLYDRAYFGPDTHLGGFMLGVVLAGIATLKSEIKPAKKTWSRVKYAGMLVAAMGVVLGLAFLVRYEDARVFEWALAATALLTTVAIWAILKLQSEKRHKWLVATEYLGGLSFYLYLFHWPLFVLLPSFIVADQWVIALVAGGGSLLLAVVADKIWSKK